MPAEPARPRIRRGNERGATVVEFAVIAILLLTVTFGILEFALIFMQSHLVEQRAREGVRVGVRANNYTEFDTNDPTCSALPHKCNRVKATKLAVQNYLDVFSSVPDDDIEVVSSQLEVNDPPVLTVTVTVANFLPPLLSALVPGYTPPETFTYTTTGFYEDPDEYAKENL